MGTQVEKPEEKEPVRVRDVTRPHLRRFFDCVDKPPGETVVGGPWKKPEHGFPLKEKR